MRLRAMGISWEPGLQVPCLAFPLFSIDKWALLAGVQRRFESFHSDLIPSTDGTGRDLDSRYILLSLGFSSQVPASTKLQKEITTEVRFLSRLSGLAAAGIKSWRRKTRAGTKCNFMVPACRLLVLHHSIHHAMQCNATSLSPCFLLLYGIPSNPMHRRQ